MASTVHTLPAVLSSLALVQAREKAVSAELAQLVASEESIQRSLARLRAQVPSLDELLIDADLLKTRVHSTAKTADRVGGRVRTLDDEMSRIRQAADRVAQVTELKSSLAALYDAIERGDWEAAARHCARVMAIPTHVLNGNFAARAVPTSDLPLPPPQSLQAARDTLLYNFQTHFDKAAAARDAAATSRFFKLFPSVGWHTEGLEAYSAFVVDLVASRATTSAKPSSPMYFVASLTSLFEAVALIVDQHQPLVEKYYGSSAMRPVVSKLLDACHSSLSTLFEAWDEERQMPRKLAEVTTSTTTTPAPAATAPQGKRQIPPPVEDSIDPREIDKVLSDFLPWLAVGLETESDLTSEDQQNDVSDPEPVPIDTSLIDSSACRSTVEGVLEKYYLPLESWYLRTVIDKAHRLAQPSTSSGPMSTTLPDDVFYVLKVALVRLLTTGSGTTVDRTCLTIKDIISRDLVGALKRKMDDIYRPGVAGARSEKGERDARAVFVLHLNDLSLSASHLERLSAELATSPVIDQNFLDGSQGGGDMKKTIGQLGTEVSTMRGTLKTSVEHLFSHTARPRLRTLWPDTYKDVTYLLDDEAYALAEQADLVRKRFTKTWEAAAEPVREKFNEENVRLFFGLMVDVVVRPWERYLMGLRFTDLGAIRFDQDLRFIISYLSSQVHASIGLRERFTRLQQIATLLNLDAEEDLDEFYNGSGIAWRVSIAEARAVVALRV
ncbi:COG4-domain-containing protein [Auriculariales sp. MPI-PUGE-AT-0066]|nr:COG4-domain-containing protein [Auriculariales sp. MPI-PUGE-AT-0066]